MVKTREKILGLEIIIQHIKNNLRGYIILSLVFIIGVFLGVMFINSAKDDRKTEISEYISTYVDNIKEQPINNVIQLRNSIRENIILAIILWLAGTTLVGIPIVFGIIMFRGFCLGYTISACTYTMGSIKGISFIFISLLLQNIIFIPAIIAIRSKWNKII